MVRWERAFGRDEYDDGTLVAGEVLLGLVLVWGLLRLTRGIALRRPVVLDATHYPPTLSVPTGRLSRLYRSEPVPATEVLGVDLVPHDAVRPAERRFRLVMTTTGGSLVSDAITSPYRPRRPVPAPRAVQELAALREALRLPVGR